MTKDMVMDTPAAKAAREGEVHEGISAARETIRVATMQVGDAVDSVRTSLPEMAKASRELAADALQRIEAGSDQQISAGATMSLGLAIGMLLGGAPRILIALALVPVAAIGIVMLGRRPVRSVGTAPSAPR
jgi:hypothetical protein